MRPTAMVRADAASIAAAGACLARGGLVAFATETVYGLGADAGNARAVAALYAAKGRPAFNPLIVHVLDLAAAERVAQFHAPARRLARLWPGPLTLVLRKSADCPVCDLATAGLDTVAVRVPSHPSARAILAAFGGPVVAPSANRSGHVSPTTAAHVLSDLAGRIDMIVDGGPCAVGVESSIVGFARGRAVLLRPGGLSRDALTEALGEPLAASPAASLAATPEAPPAPGMLASHYAPRAPMRLEAREVRPGEALLAFGPALPDAARAVAVRNLSPGGDLEEAAANLFAHLRALDALAPTAIAVMPIPNAGLGEAIRDRLARAAAPKLAIPPR